MFIRFPGRRLSNESRRPVCLDFEDGRGPARFQLDREGSGNDRILFVGQWTLQRPESFLRTAIESVPVEDRE